MDKTINDIGFDEFRKAVWISFNRDFTEQEREQLSAELLVAIVVTAKEVEEYWNKCGGEEFERITPKSSSIYR